MTIVVLRCEQEDCHNHGAEWRIPVPTLAPGLLDWPRPRCDQCRIEPAVVEIIPPS